MSSRPLLWKGYEGMRKLLLTNIGMLATPQGRAAKKGPEQGAIQMLKNAWGPGRGRRYCPGGDRSCS